MLFSPNCIDIFRNMAFFKTQNTTTTYLFLLTLSEYILMIICQFSMAVSMTGITGCRILDVFDLPQRRWYQVTLPETSSIWPVPLLTEKEEEELEKAAGQYVSSSQGQFNIITVDVSGNVSYDLKASIGRALLELEDPRRIAWFSACGCAILV